VLCSLLGAAEHGTEATVEEENQNYEEKAQEIVQSILQEVINTVAGGELYSSCCEELKGTIGQFNQKCVLFNQKHNNTKIPDQ